MRTHRRLFFYFLDNAKEEIYITDWWLSPEVHLKRPVLTFGDEFRLDRLLQKKAKQGVKVKLFFPVSPWYAETVMVQTQVDIIEMYLTVYTVCIHCRSNDYNENHLWKSSPQLTARRKSVLKKIKFGLLECVCSRAWAKRASVSWLISSSRFTFCCTKTWKWPSRSTAFIPSVN